MQTPYPSDTGWWDYNGAHTGVSCIPYSVATDYYYTVTICYYDLGHAVYMVFSWDHIQLYMVAQQPNTRGQAMKNLKFVKNKILFIFLINTKKIFCKDKCKE